MTETTSFPLSIETKNVVYQDKIQKIQRIVAHFEGFKKEYFVADHGKRAALLVARDQEVLLTRQYRLLINQISLGIPGGKVEKNESPVTAAVRECREETGVSCKNVKPLINYHPSLDISKNYTYLFYSYEVEEISPRLSTQRVWMPLQQAIDMIFDGSISDSLSILALFSYNILQRR